MIIFDQMSFYIMYHLIFQRFLLTFSQGVSGDLLRDRAVNNQRNQWFFARSSAWQQLTNKNVRLFCIVVCWWTGSWVSIFWYIFCFVYSSLIVNLDSLFQHGVYNPQKELFPPHVFLGALALMLHSLSILFENIPVISHHKKPLKLPTSNSFSDR